MSQTVLIPFHITKLKAIQNIHKGRDVRTEIPVAEYEEFMALRTNYAVIYEYLVNREVFPDGTKVKFERKSSQNATEGTGEVLAEISKMTTSYLGERSRAAPREVEAAPAITDSGAVELVGGVDSRAREIAGGGAPVAPRPEELPQRVEAAAVVAELPPVMRYKYQSLKPYKKHAGAKIVLDNMPPRTGVSKLMIRYMSEQPGYYFSDTDVAGWKHNLRQYLEDIKGSYRGGMFNTISSPLGHFNREGYVMWGKMGEEIKAFDKLLNEAGTEYRSEVWSKAPVPDLPVYDKTPRPRAIAAQAYKDVVHPFIDSFEAYLVSKYTFKAPRFPVVMEYAFKSAQNPDATPDVEATDVDEYNHFAAQDYIIKED